ncbi:MAG: TetR/AcrR family transcriptional regulator [Clostridiales bacterium]|jgi:AcrR family transcriptional regulator|nr:TetR/AcrR family transcriptional regulator [Clostridiales bacterium]
MENSSKKKKAATHARILHQAKILFEKNGIARTTIEDIAVASEIARSTFFTHFTALDELYAEISVGEIEDLLAVVKDLKGRGLPYDAVLKNLVSKLIDDTAKYPKTFVELFIKGILSAEKTNKNFSDIEEAICEILRYASPPTPRAATPKELYRSLLGLYFGVVFCDLICGKKIGEIEKLKSTLFLYIDTLNISAPSVEG